MLSRFSLSADRINRFRRTKLVALVCLVLGQLITLSLILRLAGCCLPVRWMPLPMYRVMLYRLHVNSLLRERQVVALIDRFDVGRKGE